MSSSLSFNINIELKKVIKDDFNFANSLTKGQSNYNEQNNKINN